MRKKGVSMKKAIKVCVPVILTCMLIAGCGGGVSEDKPIAEVKTEAQGMTLEQLKAVVSKYQKAIESKKTEIEALTAQIKKIPVAQMLGEEAKKLKGDIDSITSSVRALTERLNIYAQELRRKQ